MSDRFTEKAEKALNKSVKIAEKIGHTYIGTEHLLLAISEDPLSCAALILKKNGVDYAKIMSVTKEYSGTGSKSDLSSKDLTPRARKILESSYNNAVQLNNGVIGTEHILLALIEERDSVAIKLLKNLKVDLTAIKDDINFLTKNREKTIQRSKRDSYSPILKQYGKNLCELAKEDKFDPVIGRDSETDRLIRVLSRKNKNNPCLIGDAGVGKTAIVEGLAQRIVNRDVPSALIDKTIISVDLTSMVAGAKYRGDFEERIKNIINEVTRRKDIILFIDEIHTIVGAGAAEGAIDASNILKPQLARGELQIIGATTHNEYKKYIEKDAALERRFQPILISEPSEEKTLEMLGALKSRYESFHNVTIEDEALEECVYLSKKYISDRFLPDKAIDILDEACALAASKTKISNVITRQYEISDDFSSDITHNIISLYESEYPFENSSYKSEEKGIVDRKTIKEIISEACGVPSSMINKSIDYDQLEANLRLSVLGQEDAISKLVNTVRRSDFGFLGSERPRGIFMFLGESGVGKTALAIALAKNLFHDSSYLLRFDMSEYTEKHSIAKLIGSPPGYAGHEDGGVLTEAIRKRPNSVVLFDEIEKADKEILNILLQISDYGYLSDASGRHVSFRNAIIIVTSNLYLEGASESVGFENTNSTRNNPYSLLKRYYKEEFINRFDEIILFKSLSDNTLRQIVTDRLNDLANKISNLGYDFYFEEGVIEYIVSKSKTRKMGARPILREISTAIEDKIIDLISEKGKCIKAIKAAASDSNIIINEEIISEV